MRIVICEYNYPIFLLIGDSNLQPYLRVKEPDHLFVLAILRIRLVT